MAESIYKLITDNIDGGVLKDDFSIPEESGDDGIKWAPGAQDGVIMYHMRPQPLAPEEKEGMVKAIEAAAAGDFLDADTMFAEWTKDHRVMSCIDELQHYIAEHHEELNLELIYHAATAMIHYSTHVECVKIGLALLELFVIGEETLKESLKSLALYDELTAFAVWNIRKWDDGNEVIFDIAKKVHGWGRIHAVDMLRPDTEEIRHWLLTEGTVNDVVNAYSAYTCWDRSGARDVLFRTPSQEEFDGLVTLMDALLDEGPVRGISVIEDADKVLERFIELSKEYDIPEERKDVIELAGERLEKIKAAPPAEN